MSTLTNHLTFRLAGGILFRELFENNRQRVSYIMLLRRVPCRTGEEEEAGVDLQARSESDDKGKK